MINLNNLNQKQKDVLVGTLLGDGWMETTTKGRTYRYGFKQKQSQTSQFDPVQHVLFNLCGSKPRKNNTDFQFKTLTVPVLHFYGTCFYGIGHKKCIPENIFELLTPRALAYWYMDDGSKEKKPSAIFATNCFKYEEVVNLCFVLKQKFKLSCRPKVQKKTNTGRITWVIYVHSKSCKTFFNLIEPYIITSMRYKLPESKS